MAQNHRHRLLRRRQRSRHPKRRMAAVLPAVALAPVQTVRSLIPERSATSQTGSVLAWIAGPIFGVVA